MVAIRFHDQDEMIKWAAERIGYPFGDEAQAIGLERNDELAAVVIYDRFSEADCNMHVASNGSGHWLSLEFLRVVFWYPLVRLGLRRVSAVVPASNERALKFDEHLGFVREGYCPNALPDDDVVIMGMLKQHCRWIPKEYRNDD